METGRTIAEILNEMRGAITATRLANLLGISPITVYKMAKSGRIPCFRVGTSVRFDPGAIARWLYEGKAA
jgi:excisionase family DNA binding protein